MSGLALSQLLAGQKARAEASPKEKVTFDFSGLTPRESKPAPSPMQSPGVLNALLKRNAESPLVESGTIESVPGNEEVIGDSIPAGTDIPDEFVQSDDELGDIDSVVDLSRFNILEGMRIVPDPSQVAAYQGLARIPMGSLIGAAGTGKTTTTRLLLNCLVNGDDSAGIEPLSFQLVDVNKYSPGQAAKKDQTKEEIPAVALVAFTGQATQVLRKNMPRAWSRNCMTIHSLLGYQPVEYTDEVSGKTKMRFEPSYTAMNKMPWKVIVIDEASMVSVELWHEIRAAATDDCRFYFIGDLNQLTPPIGEGILGFALAQLPVFELTVVHRQSDESANKIVDAAWNILKGKSPEFDDPKTNHNWRVIGFELSASCREAQGQICAIANQLRNRRVDASVDPERPFIYDPWRDRIMVPMNGENEAEPRSAIGQIQLNEILAQVFAGQDAERVIIDYKKGTKRFSEGYRVMATKNEPPNRLDRVTNGLTGKIISIIENPDWTGDRRLVGKESVVAENRREMLDAALSGRKMDNEYNALEMLDSVDDFLEKMAGSTEAKELEAERQSGPSSHIVEVHFDNGAKRTYNLNAQIEQLNLAYASTTHKAQGAEMPLAIIVVHHQQRLMLSRENLYTAVTRAKERVVILYTKHGLNLALSKQEIRGSTLKEKIQKYIEFSGLGESRLKVMNVKLYPDAA